MYYPKPNNTELIMLVGIPACGKSTLSMEYESKGYNILSSDKIRIELAGTEDIFNREQSFINELNGRVFEYIKKQAYECLKSGVSVVLDATNLGRKKRKTIASYLRRTGCKRKCILFITPREVCFERNSKRDGIARVPDKSMNKMLSNFECPYYWEGWDEIVPVIYNEPYRFPMEETVGFEQDTPHHALTLSEHMKKAEEYAKEHSFPEYIVKILRYHDIGKIYVKSYENIKGEKTKFACYSGHENYSAYLYLTEMCCGKELSKEEFDKILYETNLINCHMRPHKIWRDSPGAKENDKLLFGDDFMRDLLMVHEADRFAH